MNNYELIDSNIGRDRATMHIWDIENERDLDIEVEFQTALGDNGAPVPMYVQAFDANTGLEVVNEDLLGAIELWLTNHMDNYPDAYVNALEESRQERAYESYMDRLRSE